MSCLFRQNRTIHRTFKSPTGFRFIFYLKNTGCLCRGRCAFGVSHMANRFMVDSPYPFLKLPLNDCSEPACSIFKTKSIQMVFRLNFRFSYLSVNYPTKLVTPKVSTHTITTQRLSRTARQSTEDSAPYRCSPSPVHIARIRPPAESGLIPATLRCTRFAVIIHDDSPPTDAISGTA